MSAWSIWRRVSPGLIASSIGAGDAACRATRPAPALTGTVPGITQPLPPPTLHPPFAPAPALGRVGGRHRGGANAALETAQVRIRVADGFEARGRRVGVDAREAHEHTECFAGPAAHERAARTGRLARIAVATLQLVVEMRARIVERTRGAHVDGAGRAAFELTRDGRLAHVEAREQLGREQVEVEFAILAWRYLHGPSRPRPRPRR